jgi:Flp pilus assembly protein TadD
MPKSSSLCPWLSMATVCALLAACASPSASTTKQQSGRMSGEDRERIAAAAEASGDYELALSMYAAASADAPGNSELRLHYAGMLLRTGKIGAARDVLTKGLATASDPMEIRRSLGTILVLSGQSGQAIAELNKVLAVQPNDPRALVDKAVALDLQGNHSEAQRFYLQARQAAPNDPVIANDLALSMALQGRVREARDLLVPFKNAENAPERVKVSLRIISAAIGEQEQPRGGGEVGDDAIRRMAVALASAAGTSNDGAMAPRVGQ